MNENNSLSNSKSLEKDKYCFYPRNELLNSPAQLSSKNTSRNNTKRSYNKENIKFNLKENTFYSSNKIPPVFFWAVIIIKISINNN